MEQRFMPATDFLDILANEYTARNLNLADDYEAWYKFGFGCASFGEGGRSAFHAFSRTSAKYVPTQTDKQFNACLKAYRGATNNLGYLLDLIPRHLLDFSECLRKQSGRTFVPSKRSTPKQPAPPKVDIFKLVGH